MKKIMFILITMFLFVNSSLAKNINIVCDEWPPYQYDDNDKTVGASYEIISEVFTRMGITVPEKLEMYPWVRAERMLLKGEADALFTAVYNEERAKKTKYTTVPILQSNWFLYTTKDKASVNTFNSLNDLKGKQIGGVRGYAYPKEFTDFINTNATFQYVSNDELNVRKLIIGGRVDYIIMDELNANLLLNKMQAKDQIVRMMNPVEPISLYLIFSKDTPSELVDKFDTTLKEFKSSPEYGNVLNNYK